MDELREPGAEGLRDRTRIREAFVQIVREDFSEGVADDIIGAFDQALGATPAADSRGLDVRDLLDALDGHLRGLHALDGCLCRERLVATLTDPEPASCRCVRTLGARQPTFGCPVHAYDPEPAS